MSQHFMTYRGKLSITSGTESQMLIRLWAGANRAEHLRPIQYQFHRSFHESSRHRGKYRIRPQLALAAETSAEEQRHHAHILSGQAEHRGKLLLVTCLLYTS